MAVLARAKGVTARTRRIASGGKKSGAWRADWTLPRLDHDSGLWCYHHERGNIWCVDPKGMKPWYGYASMVKQGIKQCIAARQWLAVWVMRGLL